MLTLTKAHLCIAVSALAFWPSFVSARQPWHVGPQPFGPHEENWAERNEQDPDSKAGLAGRSDSDPPPLCVKVSESFETADYGWVDEDGNTWVFYYLGVEIPKGSPLKCVLTGAEEGRMSLNMQTYGDNRYCYIAKETDSIECSLIGPFEQVEIYLEYYGPPTTMELTCSNEQPDCTEPDCGDGYCSAGYETPVSPAGDPELFCKTDCGATCGDGVCNPNDGEDESNCLRDCFICAAVKETLTLEAEETKEYDFELLEGEWVECYEEWFDIFPGEITVAMRYDEPACAYTEVQPTFFPYPTASPTSSVAPGYSPPCYLENDCNSYYSCGLYEPVESPRTVYVTIYSRFGFDGNFVCRKYPCDLPETPSPTNAPVTSNPTGGPTSTPTASPTSSPTQSPTTSPTAAPTVAEDEGFFLCFSERTEVEVLGQGPTRMDALKIGDTVHVADGTYSKVYSFGHRDPSRAAKFLQIWTDETPHPLEITGNHLLYVLGKSTSKNSVKMLPASAVKVGDLLVTPKGSAAITSITTVQRQGLYAPFTMSGNLVANGVACSNYIALPEAFQDWASFEQQHWLQHIAIMPYRLYCGPAGCQGETYDEATGFAKAVMLWLPLLHFVESALPWLTHATAIGLAYFVWKKQQGYKISKAKAVE